MKIAVVGGGVGGLSAAVRLSRAGHDVRLYEARPSFGGLASGVSAEVDGHRLDYDAGPYILLDRPGLAWALEQLGLGDVLERLDLVEIEDVYEVARADAPPVRLYADVDRTADELDRTWPGAGDRYRVFVRRLSDVHRSLMPILTSGHPGPLSLFRHHAVRHAPFLLRSLGGVLGSSRLPQPVVDALGIWTHIAGQRLGEAPSPLAFVPALVHTVGCYLPKGGIRAIPAAFEAAAREAGAELLPSTPVRRIRVERGRAVGVETDGGFFPADVVLSDAPGVGTYLELVPETPDSYKRHLDELPLQSPGACAYLAVRGTPEPPYLRFWLPTGPGAGGDLCRCLVSMGVVLPEQQVDGWYPARLVAPMRHDVSERDPDGQKAYLDRMLAETWWRRGWDEVRVLTTRTPRGWGREFHLWRDSMNPVMTAKFMREGRLAHKSPHVEGLYLAGSATHPGQWVSFCAISGVLAANEVLGSVRA